MKKTTELTIDAIVTACRQLHDCQIEMLRTDCPKEAIIRIQEAISEIETIIWNISKSGIDNRIPEE